MERGLSDDTSLVPTPIVNAGLVPPRCSYLVATDAVIMSSIVGGAGRPRGAHGSLVVYGVINLARFMLATKEQWKPDLVSCGCWTARSFRMLAWSPVSRKLLNRDRRIGGARVT